MKYLSLVVLLAGCSGNPTSQELLRAIEFGPDERGCARISGNLEVEASVFASTTVNVLIVKAKGEDAPDC